MNEIETDIKNDINITQLFIQNYTKQRGNYLQKSYTNLNLKARKGVKINKAPAKSGITAEMLKSGGRMVIIVLQIILNQILEEERIPNK